MECFRIDESGYTGYELLNPEQRFQGAAAVAISDEDAAHLIRTHFPRLQASELKYRAIVKRPNYRAPMLEMLRAVMREYKCVTYICDKRYLLLLMFLDYATEPFYYERGLNFYKDGQNYTLASLLYYVGPTIFGKDAFESLLLTFQRAMKEKTPEAIGSLVQAARSAKWTKLPEALGPLAHASPSCLSAIANPDVSTDAAMVVLESVISRLEVMADGAYRIEHDESKNLRGYHDLLQQLIDHRVEIEFRQSKLASIKFPLKLTAVTQVDSKASPAVQIADVMVGAAMELANSLTRLRNPVLDPQALLALYRNDQIIHLLPSLDFDAQKEFRRGTQASEVIDYFAENFHGTP